MKKGWKRRVFTEENIGIIHRMVYEGKSPGEIAAVIGTTPRSLVARCCQLGIPLRIDESHLSAKVDPACVEAFESEAKKRNMQPTQFLRMILTTIARENLFNAVIDE